MTTPKISVLLTVYNLENYIAESIESILAQTHTSLELIIIDDGSTDRTMSIVAEFAQRDQRVIVLQNQENLGPYNSLNRGLAVATGDYLTRQDGDDISLPDRLGKQVAFLEDNPDHCAVGTSVAMIDQYGSLIRVATVIEENDEIQNKLLDHMCCYGATFLIRRSYLEEIGFRYTEDMTYSQDYDLCLRLAEVGKLANINLPLYKYRQHPASISYSKRHQQMFFKAQALEQAVYRRFGQTIPDHMAKLVARDYLRAAVTVYLAQEVEGSRAYLGQALHLCPALLDDGYLVEKIVRRYTRDMLVDSALAFTRGLFAELLPHTWSLSRSKRRLLAEFHIKEMFSALARGEQQQAQRHLWPAITQNPVWLLNRGVLSLSIRSVIPFLQQG